MLAVIGTIIFVLAAAVVGLLVLAHRVASRRRPSWMEDDL